MSEQSADTAAAWLCRFDGSVHRRGIHHDGDVPLVPATRIAEARAQAWDEGATKASPHGGGYLRSLLIENPYRDPGGVA